MKHSLLVIGIALACGSSACRAQVALGGPRARVASRVGSDRAAELCAGLPQSELERPTFLRRGGIETVRPLREGPSSTRRSEDEVRGADIYVRPSAALTQSYLTR